MTRRRRRDESGSTSTEHDGGILGRRTECENIRTI